MPRRDLSVASTAVPVFGPIAAIPENFAYPGLSPAQLFSIIRAYRIPIVIIVLTVLSATVLIVALLPRTYAATATLMVSYEVNDPLNGEEFPIGLLGSYVATQIELLQNPEVLLPVVDRLALTSNKDYVAGYRGDGSTLREWAASRLSRNLAIYRGPYDSQLIHVTYSASDAADAARVANTVSDVYLEQDFARSTGPANDRAKRYAEQLSELKDKVRRAQDEATAFQQRNALVDSGTTADVDIKLLANLNQQLAVAQNQRQVAEARASADQSVGAQVLASPLIQSLKTQLAAQQVRLAELERTYVPQRRPVVELEAQIAVTRAALASETNSYASNASAELAVARQLEQRMRTAVEAQQARVLAVNRLHDDAQKYQLALESTQAVYRRALEGYDQIMFASRSRYTNVNVISRARPPLKATSPRVLVDLLLGCIAAGILGLAVPVGYELLNRRVRCRDDLERDYGVPVLAEFGPLPMARRAS